MKVCTKCKIEKSLENFNIDRQKKDGLRPICRKCDGFGDRRPIPKTGFKFCSKCKIEKELSEFGKDSHRKDGLKGECKACLYPLYSRPKIAKLGYKFCSKCGEEKIIDEFNKLKSSKDGYRPDCKECRKIISFKYYGENSNEIIEYQENYRLSNPEKLVALRKDHYSKNSESIKKQTRDYYIKNKKIVIKKGVEYSRKRKIYDPGYRLKITISSAFNCRLKCGGVKKEGATFTYTGVTWKEYVDHFKTDPLWVDYKNKNRGLSIDHIIPVSLFNFNDKEEVKKCWHPRNLRLLPIKENMFKSNKLLPELVKFYNIEDLLPKGINIT